mgnify:CR=1 FL=1
MKKLTLILVCLFSYQAYSQVSFVEHSKNLRVEQIEFEKINEKAKESLFPIPRKNRSKLKEGVIPVTAVTSEDFSLDSRISASLSVGYLLGDFGRTNNPNISIRGVYDLDPRYKSESASDFAEGKIEPLQPFALLEDVGVEEMYSQLDKARIVMDGQYVMPFQVGEYFAEFAEEGEDSKLDYKEGMPNDFWKINEYDATPEVEKNLFILNLRAQALINQGATEFEDYFDENSDEEIDWNDYSIGYRVQTWNYHLSAKYDHFFGKTEDFGDGNEIKYDGFGIFSANGGVNWNPCTSGRVELDAGPSLRFGGSTDLGFNIRLGGVYDLTPPAKRLAQNIYTGEPKTNYSITAGATYFRISGGSKLVLGAGIQANFR